jgi:thioesterase domain-containing protein/acyl carrier protein
MAQPRSGADASASRTPSLLEQQILELWNDVLKTNSTDLDQDFFLAGGDSLRAADLLSRIRKNFGDTLGLRQVFDQATSVASLARFIEQERWAGRPATGASSGLFPIKSTGDLPPLFAVPGREGSPLPWVHLGRVLDRRQPFYVLEHQGLDGRKPPLNSIPAIAAYHVRSIKKFQPEGPYYLMGACFGARVAFEMARQLQASGERVGLLIMLDPSPPFTDFQGRPRARDEGQRSVKKSATRWRYILERFTSHARSIVKLRGAARRAYLRQKLKQLREIVYQRDLFRGDRSGLYWYYQRSVDEVHLRAGRCFIPTPYDGELVLGISRDFPIAGDRDYRLDWMQLLPRCNQPVFVDGKDKWNLMDRVRAPGLAKQIDAWLEASRRELASPILRSAELLSE